MLKLNIEVVLEKAELVEENGDVKVYKLEERNDPSLFNRVLKHLQLEGKATPFPITVFDGGEDEFTVEYGQKNEEFIIKCLEKLEDRVLKEWEKFYEKVAKERAKGREPTAEEPTDSVRYVITAKIEGDEIREIIFDKRIESTLMPNRALVLRYVARL